MSIHCPYFLQIRLSSFVVVIRYDCAICCDTLLSTELKRKLGFCVNTLGLGSNDNSRSALLLLYLSILYFYNRFYLKAKLKPLGRQSSLKVVIAGDFESERKLKIYDQNTPWDEDS